MKALCRSSAVQDKFSTKQVQPCDKTLCEFRTLYFDGKCRHRIGQWLMNNKIAICERSWQCAVLRDDQIRP